MAKKIDFSIQGMDILGLTDKEKMSVKETEPEKNMVEKRDSKSDVSRDQKRKKKDASVATISSQLVLPEKKETKSEGKYFKLKPSIIAAATKKAAKIGISVNDVVNQLLQIWSEEE